MHFQLTAEQKEIVKADLDAGEILKIIAFAGTGKTYTLIEYSKLRPHKRFLYVAFNKSVQLEASGKFPKNVECRTAHSLAWSKFGYKFKNGLVSSIKGYTVKDLLNLESYEDSKFVIDTLYNYLISADRGISKSHIPKKAHRHYRFYNKIMPDIIGSAKYLWKLMLNEQESKVGMVHDGYLKLYQLSNPKLYYDCILLDEAQDINPVMSDIVLSQASSKIIVGDPHQQIYSFRGAVDILDKIQASKTMYLTQSFRFTQNIAKVANLILKTFKNEENKVVGLGSRSPKNDFNCYTYIARTNAAIFDKAAEKYKIKKIGFVGGIKGYRFNRIEDAYYLFNSERERIRNPYIGWFNNYNEMKDYAQAVEDFELISICMVVEKYLHNIPKLVREIKNHTFDISISEIILTTAHKSKGLEWCNVVLADDFPDLIDQNDEIIDPKRLEPDEFNIIYVAATRSKERIRVKKDSSITKFLKVVKTKKKKYFGNQVTVDKSYSATNAIKNNNHTKKSKSIRPSSIRESVANDFSQQKKIYSSSFKKVEEYVKTLPVRYNLTDDRLLKIRETYPRAYEAWTSQEDDMLRTLYSEEKNVNKLAKVFRRQPSAIRSRIEKIY